MGRGVRASDVNGGGGDKKKELQLLPRRRMVAIEECPGTKTHAGSGAVPAESGRGIRISRVSQLLPVRPTNNSTIYRPLLHADAGPADVGSTEADCDLPMLETGRAAPTEMGPLKSFGLTHVRYSAQDPLGPLMALASLAPQFIMCAYAVLILARRELTWVNACAAQLGNEALNWMLKRTLRMPRPASAGGLGDGGTGYGMPSSHSQFMGFFAAFCLLHLHAHRPRSARAPVRLVACARKAEHVASQAFVLLLSLATVFSRWYLGYHNASQVLVGSFLGLLVGGVYWHMTENLARNVIFLPFDAQVRPRYLFPPPPPRTMLRHDSSVSATVGVLALSRRASSASSLSSASSGQSLVSAPADVPPSRTLRAPSRPPSLKPGEDAHPLAPPPTLKHMHKQEEAAAFSDPFRSGPSPLLAGRWTRSPDRPCSPRGGRHSSVELIPSPSAPEAHLPNRSTTPHEPPPQRLHRRTRYPFPALRQLILDHPLAILFRLRDSYHVWNDGGLEADYRHWRIEYEKRRLWEWDTRDAEDIRPFPHQDDGQATKTSFSKASSVHAHHQSQYHYHRHNHHHHHHHGGSSASQSRVSSRLPSRGPSPQPPLQLHTQGHGSTGSTPRGSYAYAPGTAYTRALAEKLHHRRPPSRPSPATPCPPLPTNQRTSEVERLNENEGLFVSSPRVAARRQSTITSPLGPTAPRATLPAAPAPPPSGQQAFAPDANLTHPSSAAAKEQNDTLTSLEVESPQHSDSEVAAGATTMETTSDLISSDKLSPDTRGAVSHVTPAPPSGGGSISRALAIALAPPGPLSTTATMSWATLSAAEQELHAAWMIRSLRLAAQCPPTETAFCVGSILRPRGAAGEQLLSTGFSRELEGNTHAEQCVLNKLSGALPGDHPDSQQESVTKENPTTNRDEEGVQELPLDLYTTMEPCSERLSGALPCLQRILAFNKNPPLVRGSHLSQLLSAPLPEALRLSPSLTGGPSPSCSAPVPPKSESEPELQPQRLYRLRITRILQGVSEPEDFVVCTGAGSLRESGLEVLTARPVVPLRVRRHVPRVHPARIARGMRPMTRLPLAEPDDPSATAPTEEKEDEDFTWLEKECLRIAKFGHPDQPEPQPGAEALWR